MKMKRTLPVLLAVMIFVAACQGSSQETPLTDTVATAVVDSEEAVVDNPQQESQEELAPGEPFTSAETPCKPFSLIGEKMVTPRADLPEVTAEDWAVGPADAPVTFMEYSELQCPYCAQLEPLLVAVQERYPDDVRLVFRHRPFPVSFHDKSILAAQAMEAAGEQGLFSEFKNFMFEQQGVWSGIAPKDFDAWLTEQVPALGIDADQFLDDMYSDAIVKKIEAAADSANLLEINGTPTLFVNGYPWPEQERGVEIFSIYVQLIKHADIEYAACSPNVLEEGKDYRAVISTSQGDIEIDLLEDAAPVAVNSFVYLAREGWYEDNPFITTAEFALSGDPSDTGYGGPGYAYLDESDDAYTLDEAGMVATFSLGEGINGSTFFINKEPLEGQLGRTVFGTVTSGMDVVNSLSPRDNIFSPAADTINSITISEQ